MPSKKRPHRKVKDDEVIKVDVIRTEPSVKFVANDNRQVGRSLNVQFTVDKPVNSSDELTSREVDLDRQNSDLSVNWDTIDPDELEDHEVMSVLAELYPDIQDNYILMQNTKVKGYEVMEDGVIVEVNGEIIPNFDPKEADFYFIPAKKDDVSSELLDGIDKLERTLPEYKSGEQDRNVWGRAYILAVISESGKIYGLRVEPIDLDDKPKGRGLPPLRLFRKRSNKANRQLQKEHRRFLNTPKKNMSRTIQPIDYLDGDADE